MASSEERIKILKLISEGRITAAEGVQLLETLEGSTRASSQSNKCEPVQAVGRGGKWFRVRVTDTDTGKVRVNIRLPVEMVTTGVNMGAKFSPEVDGLDIEALLAHIRNGETGRVLDVLDEQDGEHIEVFIE